MDSRDPIRDFFTFLLGAVLLSMGAFLFFNQVMVNGGRSILEIRSALANARISLDNLYLASSIGLLQRLKIVQLQPSEPLPRFEFKRLLGPLPVPGGLRGQVSETVAVGRHPWGQPASPGVRSASDWPWQIAPGA